MSRKPVLVSLYDEYLGVGVPNAGCPIARNAISSIEDFECVKVD